MKPSTLEKLEDVRDGLIKEAVEYMEYNKNSIFKSIVKKEMFELEIEDTLGSFRFQIDTITTAINKLKV